MDDVILLPYSEITVFQNKLDQVTKNIHSYDDISQSDTYEALGKIQLYTGDFKHAIFNLEESIKPPNFLSVKPPKSVAIIKILLANTYFRLGFQSKAEDYLRQVLDITRPHDFYSLSAIALSNLALIKVADQQIQENISFAQEAVELAKKSPDGTLDMLLSHVRVLYGLYIRSHDYVAAKNLIRDCDFSSKERALLLAGIAFAGGHYQQGFELLARQQKFFLAVSLSSQPNKEKQVGFHSDSEDDRDDTLFDGVHRAIILHNMTVLQKNSMEYLHDAVHIMEQYCHEIMRRRQDDIDNYVKNTTKHPHANTHHTTADNVQSSLSMDWDKYPNYLTYDLYLYPFVVLANLLQAKAEQDFQCIQFNAGTRIEIGQIFQKQDKIVISMDDTMLQIREMEKKFERSQEILKENLLHNKLIEIPEVKVEVEEDVHRGRSASRLHIHDGVETDSTHEVNHHTAPSHHENNHIPSHGKPVPHAPPVQHGQDKHNTHPVHDDFAENIIHYPSDSMDQHHPDGHPHTAHSSSAPHQTHSRRAKHKIAISDSLTDELHGDLELFDNATFSNSINNAKLFEYLTSAQPVNTSLATASAWNLRNDFKVTVSNTSGQIVQTAAHSVSQPPTSSHHGKPHTSSLRKDNSSHGLSRESSTKKLNKVGNKPHSSRKLVHEEVNPVTNEYHSERHDSTTIRAELMLLTERFGHNESTAWIQWAIANSGGLGYGTLFQSSLNPLEEWGYNHQKIKEKLPSNDFLLEVLHRLKELEVHLMPDFDGEVFVYKSGKIESRILVSFIMVKVTAQLNLKEETGLMIHQCEDLLQEFSKLHPPSNDYHIYSALYHRSRLDYEEWCTSRYLPDDELLMHYVKGMLIFAKNYVKATKMLSDVQLHRDALKKLINVYLAINRLQISDKVGLAGGGGVAVETQSKKMEVVRNKKGTLNNLTLKSKLRPVEDEEVVEDEEEKEEVTPFPIPTEGQDEVVEPATPPPPELNESEKFLLIRNELDAIHEEKIEELETTDVRWVHKYSKALAMKVMKQMKEYSHSVA